MNAYEKIGSDESILTNLYRFSVLTKIFGIEADKEIEVKRLSEKTINDIRIDDYRDGMDRLAMLFGAGFLDEEVFCRIIKNEMIAVGDIAAAENKVINENGRSSDDKLTKGIVQNALLCALISKKYPQIQSIDFEQALEAAETRHSCLIDGVPKIKDKEFFGFLLDIGEPFGHINIQSGEIYVESNDNLLNMSADDDFDICSEEAPFMLNVKSLIYISQLYDKPYGKDFIRYAKEKEIAADGTYESRYEEYLKNVKLHFEVRSSRRRRNICGNTVNWFDYAAAAEVGITEDLSTDYRKDIDIDPSGNYSDDELIRKASDKFRSVYTLEENTVIEIWGNGAESLFIVKGSGLVKLNKSEFHTMLFDFNKIWSIIQECSRKGQITKQNENIILPQEIWEEIPPKERIYAARLIKEQYARLTEQKKSNKLLKSFSDLRSAAAEQRQKKEQAEAEKKMLQQQYNEKKKSRGSSTEG